MAVRVHVRLESILDRRQVLSDGHRPKWALKLVSIESVKVKKSKAKSTYTAAWFSRIGLV